MMGQNITDAADKTKEAGESGELSTYEKAYLIDSENISDEWVDVLDTMGERDAVFVFYTAKSTHINCERVYKLMRCGIGRVQWIKCFEGNNALDFQLVTELGAMIGKGRAEKYIIVSKDNGYNPVVRYWQERGIDVLKERPNSNKKAEESAKTVCEETEAVLEEPGKAVSDRDFLHKLLKSVDIMDNARLYGALTAFEGMETGAEEYRRLRDLNEKEKEALRGLLLEERYERGVNYVRLLMERNGLATDDKEELYMIILKGPKKNKDKYQKVLIERFGKELGKRYYLMTKSHYNYVKKV